MKKHILLLAAVAMSLTGCWTSIHTVAPTTEYVAPVTTVYTTQVTTPTPKVTTTTTVTVTSFNNDWSFYLDLQAVGAAFAEANTVEEFERLLNSSRYMINNLDLNRDGYIDYLRVLETYQGYRHVFLIQACLAPSVFQDVATLIAEWRSDRLYVEVIGDRYIYGYNYVVRPVFVQRPPLWTVFGRPHYNPWFSPYHHGHFPSHYQYLKPIYLNHYQAYINTYMHNHHYCHHCDYPQQPYWDGYTHMTDQHRRHDYQDQHPNDSFDQRVTHQLTANGSGVTVRNAGELRNETQRQQSSSREGSSASSGTSSRTSSTSSTTSSPSRTTGTSTTSTQTSGTSTRTSQTSQTSQTASQKPSSSTVTRQPSSAQTGSAQSTSRQQTTTQTTSSSSSSRSSQTSSQQSTVNRQPSTSVSMRVNTNGSTRTTIRQTNEQGKTTTVQRTSTPVNQQRTTSSQSSSSSQRSGSSSSSSSSGSRTSGGSSSGSSTRR